MSAFQSCRIFLSQLGFLGEEGRKRLQLVDNNTLFVRSLKELDSLKGREIHKLGILYVGPGQEDQNDILKNSNGSELYAEFVAALGSRVDLKTHTGFTGGLDRNLSAGKESIYYATATNEIMFHVATMMPTREDEQQIEKKKHIGNDFVHIIWSEHKRDYKPTTITSHFNGAHIVIYPLPNGLFRIQVFRKERLSFFGPLLDGMVVNKEILVPLVRQTAINASRRARNLSKGFKKPFPTRNAFIKEVLLRYKVDKTFDEFLASLYPLKSISISSTVPV